MVSISVADIKKYGQKSRALYDDITENTNIIINTFEDYLTQECGLPWNAEFADKYGPKQVRVGPNGEMEHHIFAIDSELVEGFDDDGEVWIDLTFDRFSEANKNAGKVTVSYPDEDLNPITIIGPDNPAQSGEGPYKLGIIGDS